MGRFDDVLKTISDAQERDAIVKVLEKNPDFKKGIEGIERLAADGETYNVWYRDPKGYPEFKAAHDALPKLEQDLEEANRLLAEAKAGKPAKGAKEEETPLDEMTPEQMLARVEENLKAKGYVTAAEATRLATEAATTAAAGVQARVYTQGLPMVERMMAVQDKYRKDFGKDMDRKAFGKFIEDQKFSDVDHAYEAFTREDYVNKVKAEAFDQGVLKGTKDTTEKLTRESSEAALRSLPVDMGGTHGFSSRPGEPPKPVAMSDIKEDYQLGPRGGFKLAHAVAAQIATDKAAGKTQP